MRILFLDDDSARHDRFKMNTIGCIVTHVFSYSEAVKALDEVEAGAPRFDAIYLDHDLSWTASAGMADPSEKTGYHVAERVASLPVKSLPDFVVIHSFNQAGAYRMGQALLPIRAHGVRIYREPFNPAKTGRMA